MKAVAIGADKILLHQGQTMEQIEALAAEMDEVYQIVEVDARTTSITVDDQSGIIVITSHLSDDGLNDNIGGDEVQNPGPIRRRDYRLDR